MIYIYTVLMAAMFDLHLICTPCPRSNYWKTVC